MSNIAIALSGTESSDDEEFNTFSPSKQVVRLIRLYTDSICLSPQISDLSEPNLAFLSSTSPPPEAEGKDLEIE